MALKFQMDKEESDSRRYYLRIKGRLARLQELEAFLQELQASKSAAPKERSRGGRPLRKSTPKPRRKSHSQTQGRSVPWMKKN